MKSPIICILKNVTKNDIRKLWCDDQLLAGQKQRVPDKELTMMGHLVIDEMRRTENSPAMKEP